ncbi:hypothetical protein GC175_02280 [bacterium]|nr:hypothetical protein [bacterium]
MSKRASLFLIVAIGALLFTGVAVAQISANYNISWLGFGAGAQRESTNYRLQDSAGQAVADTSVSGSYRIESGFVAGLVPLVPAATPTNTHTPIPGTTPTFTPTPTPTFTPTHTPSQTPTPSNTPTNTPTFTPTFTPSATPTVTNTPTITPTPSNTPDPLADIYEVNNTCAQARSIPLDTVQQHNFHVEGDVDWIKFNAQAGQTYIIQIENVGSQADAVIFLYDSCVAAPATANNNAFGSTVTIEWDSNINGEYFMELRQFDPARFGPEANYRISVRRDQTPPSAPTNPRCIAINDTTIGVQWKRSPERDVRQYRVSYSNESNTFSGNDDVLGGDTTYYELGALTPGQEYELKVQALDFSNNTSAFSGEVQCRALTPADTTKPVITIQQPQITGIFSTTAGSITINGVATDSGGNLSRANAQNTTANATVSDFSLEGSSDTFRLESLPLAIGDNTIKVQVLDAAGNMSEQTITVRRLGNSAGAVIIVAGHNETFGLQTNIYNSTNRAYRIFLSAGFSPDDIYYIAPVNQDANNDGVVDTDALASPAAVQQAITVWAKDKVGPDKPLFVYLMDHGLENKFCVTGCSDANSVTPDQLNTWLTTLETESGVADVTVVYEACVSGSFIQRAGTGLGGSISKLGRVIITSTGFNNNAYASAQGAYFSDTFFSCLADSGDLKSCFDEARLAVLATGINQTPMLDDNGDGVYNPAQDGTVAQTRFVTRFFNSVRPVITSTDIQLDNSNGTLRAQINEGVEAMDLVWAAVFPPDFVEPTDITLNLNVPVVRLEPVAGQPGQFSVFYPNGFTQGDGYRVVFYAQDAAGLGATPIRHGESTVSLFLPLVEK